MIKNVRGRSGSRTGIVFLVYQISNEMKKPLVYNDVFIYLFIFFCPENLFFGSSIRLKVLTRVPDISKSLLTLQTTKRSHTSVTLRYLM